MSRLSTIRMTADQYLRLGEDPPGVRLDLVDGSIVVSAGQTATHSEVVVNVMSVLHPHIRKNRLGELFMGLDAIFGEHTVRRPDLAFVSQRRAHIVRRILNGAPDLCIEIISSASATDDRVEKFELYRASGVKHYWIIDPHARMAEAFSLKNGRYVLAASGRDNDKVKFPPFVKLTIKLADIWPDF